MVYIIYLYSGDIYGKCNVNIYQHLQVGVPKWFRLTGVNSPSLRVELAPRLEGAGIYNSVDFYGKCNVNIYRTWNLWETNKRQETEKETVQVLIKSCLGRRNFCNQEYWNRLKR